MWETALRGGEGLQQRCAISLQEVNQCLCILVFKTELLMIGKDQINPSVAEITPRFCPSYITHINTTFAYFEKYGDFCIIDRLYLSGNFCGGKQLRER